MKTKWNVDPTHSTTILRLISELEGTIYILDCLDEAEEELEFISNMRKKYYKQYYKMIKNE